MVLLVLMLFNGLILFCFTVLGYSAFKPLLTPLDYFVCGLITFALISSLAFLFHSPLGQWYLRFVSATRQPIERERRLLDPLIAQVQAAVQAKHGLTPLPLQVRIVDEPMPSAFAIGKNTVVFSRALYETATPDELMGVIAHELGHLHAGDSNKLGIALGVSVITLTLAFLAGLVVAFFDWAGKASEKNEAAVFLQLVTLCLMLFSLIFLLFVWLGNGIFRLALLFVGRKQEYRADQFAVKAGFGAGLLSFLDKVKNFEWSTQKGLLAKLYATHPPVMLRIGQIEKSITT